MMKMTNILARQLAENLRAHRVKHLLSKEKLGDRLGLHRTYIGRIEAADENLSLASVDGLARKLRMHVSQLLLDGEVLRADREAWAVTHRPEPDDGAVPPLPGAPRDRATNVLAEQLAVNLRAHRAVHGLSQEELAERLGRSRAHVARIEAGQNVTLGKVVALAGLLGLHPADLLDGPLLRADRQAWEERRRAEEPAIDQ